MESHANRTFIMRVRPYRTRTNLIDGVVVTFTDITARKAAEEKARRLSAVVSRERDRLRALLDTIADEIWVCDARGTIILANRAALTRLRLTTIDEAAAPLTVESLQQSVRDRDGRLQAAAGASLLRALRGEASRNVEELERAPDTDDVNATGVLRRAVL